MTARKPIRKNIGSRLQRVFSADERERELEDRVRDSWDDAPEFTQHEELEPVEADEEPATEMGLHRHTEVPEDR